MLNVSSIFDSFESSAVHTDSVGNNSFFNSFLIFYAAERKQSLGYDWHPECLRCEECGKRLNPGQHAEHKGIPYCHVPCYGALFGPQLFGHGTRVESHKSFGVKGSSPKTPNNSHAPSIPRDHLHTKLKQYNQHFDSKSHEIRSREVNGRLVLEGALRVYWGVQGMIHLKEDDDQRTVVTVRKRNSCRYSNSTDFSSEKSVSLAVIMFSIVQFIHFLVVLSCWSMVNRLRKTLM